jgi:hypothetical protein
MHLVKVNLEDTPYDLVVGGNNQWGKDYLELDHDDDLTKNTIFEDTGYIVSSFLSKDECEELRNKLKNILSDKLELITKVKLRGDDLLNYHNEISTEQHLNFTGTIYKNGRGINFKLLNNFRKKIENRVSELCGVQVTTKMPGREYEEFYIRVTRPVSIVNHFDNNPPHRDIYIDRLRNALNIYFPIIGSNKKNSLGIIPYSHRWKENEIKRIVSGTEIQGYKYTVSCITDTKFNGLNMIRPQPEEDEVFLFSPYCIHGGAPNFSEKTRMSLEIRFWRK